jgi:hypothetical protein
MSERVSALLANFERLSKEDKFDFLDAVLRHVRVIDLGPLEDDLVAKAGDDLASGPYEAISSTP